jgi:hypothetical protein
MSIDGLGVGGAYQAGFFVDKNDKKKKKKSIFNDETESLEESLFSGDIRSQILKQGRPSLTWNHGLPGFKGQSPRENRSSRMAMSEAFEGMEGYPADYLKSASVDILKDAYEADDMDMASLRKVITNSYKTIYKTVDQT